MKSTGGVAPSFGPFNPISVLVFCAFQRGVCLQNSVYVSVIGIFVEYVGLCWLFNNTISTRGSGVPRGPCFSCGV